MENRTKTRFRLPHTVICEDLEEHKPFYTVVKDLSQGGVNLVCDESMQIDHTVKLDINLVQNRIQGQGQVRWCTKNEDRGRYNVGIQFTELDNESKDSLSSFIEGIAIFS